jgi:Glucodextranase, domain B
MAIQNVKATINGQTYTLTYNGATGKYEATVTAPTVTSFNQPGGYYGVVIEATDVAGNITTKNSTDTTNRLVVKEKVPPVISNLSPSANARLTTAAPKITGTLTDETNGSGVDKTSFVLKVNGVAVSNTGVTFTDITNGFNFSYDTSGLPQGNNTITVDVKDNDGNVATQKSVTFVIDTVAPSLNVTSPAEGSITKSATLNVVGTTGDATSGPVTVTVKRNGVDQGTVSVNVDTGAFSKSITLVEGSNSIEVKVVDTAGLATTITRNVTLDTVAPTITGIEIVPNPVDAGATFIIRVTATD